MPHLNVGAQKWTVTEGISWRQQTGDRCASQRDFSLGEGGRMHALTRLRPRRMVPERLEAETGGFRRCSHFSTSQNLARQDWVWQ